MEFEKTIELNIDDLFHSRIRNRSALIIQFVLAFYIFILSCSLLGVFFLWSLLISSLLVSLIILFSIRSIKNDTKTLFTSTRILRLPEHIKLDDTGVHTCSEIGTTNLLWQDINKIEQTKHAFYFFLYSRASIIIPKRLLNADETAVIQDIITKKFLKP